MQTAELIAHFLAGEPATVRQAQGWIRGTLAGYRDRLGAELEDLEQEILTQLIESLRAGRFQGRSGLKTYVKSFAHHKAIDRLRVAGRRQWVGVDEIDLPVTGDSVFERLHQAQQVEIALRVVQRMPETCRELWRLLDRGLSYREMSTELGIAPGTLRARVMRCRKKALAVRRSILKKVHNKSRGATTK